MKVLISICLIFGCFSVGNTQITIHPGNVPPLLPSNIVENVFLGNGIDILESKYSGMKASVGLFDNAATDIGLEKGIVLSTGFAEKMLQTNIESAPINGSTSGQNVTDEDLERLAGVNVQDIAKFEITFIPSSENLSFRYVFASEEYPKFVCGDKNDVFGFFISGPKPGGGTYNSENIAKIPDPNNPGTFLDLPVTINSVNGGQPGIFADGGDCDGSTESLDYSQYYNPVPENGSPSFNAYLNIFAAQALVIPCETYTIKIAIGDGQDQNEDSAVFLEERSFSTEAIKVNINNPGIEGGLAEDCQTGSVNFSLEEPTAYDFPLDIKILTSNDLVNPALPGVDFENIQTDIFIKQGETSVDLSLIPITDNETEGTEYIYLSLQKSLCKVDTLVMPLYDNVLKSVTMADTVITCVGETFQLEADLGDVNQADNLLYENKSRAELTPDDGVIESTIDVTGLKDIALNPSIIGEICINELNHPSLDDIDIYLSAPSGQILELSTDNGAGGQSTGLANTCFSVSATKNINSGNSSESNIDPSNPSYTGSYLPEGSFEEWLHPITSELNGEYTLFVIDDTGEHAGSLNGWSISFNPKYELDYSWSPNNGLSCDDCEMTVGSLTSSQYYYLNLTDSYGCTFQDSIWIEVSQTAGIPAPVCSPSGEANLIVKWDATSYTDSYEFKIEGKERWYNTDELTDYVVGQYLVDVTSATEISISGVLEDEEVSITVRSKNGAGCNSEETKVSCTARPCTTSAPEITDIKVEDPQCSSNPNGRVIVTATSASDPLTYILKVNNNSAYNNNGTLRNIPPGKWPLRVVDALGCATEDTVVVNAAPMFEVESEFNNSTCQDENDGRISISITADNGPAEVLWNDGSNELIRTDLSAGLYTVTLTDQSGCELTSEFENINPQELVSTYLQTQKLDCAGGGPATATIFSYGGMAPYVTTWNGTITADTLTNLSPGTLTYEVTDAYGCTVTGSADVFQVDGLMVEFVDVQQSSCQNVADGSATVTVDNGSGNYTYLWSNGETTATASALESGENTVTVYDSAGCEKVSTIEITAPSQIIIDVPEINHPSCHDASDGSIELQVSGGSGSLALLWDGDVTENKISGLGGGTFCVTITDDLYCEITECFEIVAPEPLSFVIEKTNVGCGDALSGAAELQATGGSGEYLYEWQGPGNFSSQESELESLQVGEYSVRIIDSNNPGCASEVQNFTLELSGDFSAGISIDEKISCNDAADGVLSAFTNGDEAPFSFTWSTGETTEAIRNIKAGIYSVTITNSQSCEATAEMNVEEPSELSISYDTKDVNCVDSFSGEIELMIEGGTSPYTQLWNNSASGSTLTELQSGSYSVTVTDVNNCQTIEQAIQIEEPNGDILISVEITDETCYDYQNGTVSVSSENGVEPLRFQLGEMDAQNSNVFDNLAGGSYLITVIDANECFSQLEVEVAYAEEIEVEFLGDLTVGYGEDLMLEPTVDNSNGTIDYEWLAPDPTMFSCMNCQNPVISEITESFSASVMIVDETGCSREKFFNVNVVDHNELVVPTGFSPNGDGTNDYLTVYGSKDIIINQFRIYNEIGQIVFSTENCKPNDEPSGWNGNSEGEMCPSGSYIWTTDFTCPDGRTETLTGQTTLIR